MAPATARWFSLTVLLLNFLNKTVGAVCHPPEAALADPRRRLPARTASRCPLQVYRPDLTPQKSYTRTAVARPGLSVDDLGIEAVVTLFRWGFDRRRLTRLRHLCILWLAGQLWRVQGGHRGGHHRGRHQSTDGGRSDTAGHRIEHRLKMTARTH
jgi:hypothetical protein